MITNIIITKREINVPSTKDILNREEEISKEVKISFNKKKKK